MCLFYVQITESLIRSLYSERLPKKKGNRQYKHEQSIQGHEGFMPGSNEMQTYQSIHIEIKLPKVVPCDSHSFLWRLILSRISFTKHWVCSPGYIDSERAKHGMEMIKYLSRLDLFHGLSEEARELNHVTPLEICNKGTVVASPHMEPRYCTS